ncbi:MAG: nucleotidyltransferase domain-containing protein [Cyanomargarita calcarea GSE-NOS-MK-12-04C]|jgi:predicted nucleotidyltransferase|uniref:Nucleotidyltransferase domain-containing protein n=1 Tax=Cyanomargarita calcarea GSE-NOS-MK-12-04C TaxID=2839659 RepID=A0A951UUR6_9CYAN|nr:nucleotidyltransferase domain-containing protein [Cyanomargarita calcarea GSE-NOS-MK-12-04C]
MLETSPNIERIKELAQQLPEKIPYLKLLVLFGSRATGNININSDWDFAVLYDDKERNNYTSAWGMFELPMLLEEVFGIDPEKIDIVELNHCSWLISHFVARDGILIFEKDSSGFEYFRLTCLKPESELKKFRKEQHKLIEIDLKNWSKSK